MLPPSMPNARHSTVPPSFSMYTPGLPGITTEHGSAAPYTFGGSGGPGFFASYPASLGVGEHPAVRRHRSATPYAPLTSSNLAYSQPVTAPMPVTNDGSLNDGRDGFWDYEAPASAPIAYSNSATFAHSYGIYLDAEAQGYPPGPIQTSSRPFAAHEIQDRTPFSADSVIAGQSLHSHGPPAQDSSRDHTMEAGAFGISTLTPEIGSDVRPSLDSVPAESAKAIGSGLPAAADQLQITVPAPEASLVHSAVPSGWGWKSYESAEPDGGLGEEVEEEYRS